jgi:hypothetical protein
MYEILVSRDLYTDMPLVQIATRVGCKDLKLEIPQGIPVFSDLMSNCMEYEVEDRPTFEQVVERLEAVGVNNKDQWIVIRK